MQSLKKFLLDWLFPIDCLGCNQVDGVWLCEACAATIKIHQPARSITPTVNSPALRQVWVAADYQQPLVQILLQTFKYQLAKDLAPVLGKLLANFIRQNQLDWSNCWLMPVPLSQKRQLWRGFNQAELLTQQVATVFNWRVQTDVLKRQINCRPQVGLNARARQRNVTGVFTVTNPAVIANREIILVDDVLTTGATLSECAKVLIAAGAKSVVAIVIAKD